MLSIISIMISKILISFKKKSVDSNLGTIISKKKETINKETINKETINSKNKETINSKNKGTINSKNKGTINSKKQFVFAFATKPFVKLIFIISLTMIARLIFQHLSSKPFVKSLEAAIFGPNA